MSGRRVLFYPESPSPSATITKICALSRSAIVTDPTSACDLAIAWDTNTYRARCRELERLAVDVPVWNLWCTDISKPRVDDAFTRAFGYSSLIDPLTHRGMCVTKSNLNAAHDGLVLEAPIDAPAHDRVYQRLVRNELIDGTVEDIRTPVFGDYIPLVYLQYRPVDRRFDQCDTRAVLAETSMVFTPDEYSRIVNFAGVLGLDYGELDVLRDREHGHLYIVDANPTPYGPPNALSLHEQHAALERLADAFDRFARTRSSIGEPP